MPEVEVAQAQDAPQEAPPQAPPVEELAQGVQAGMVQILQAMEQKGVPREQLQQFAQLIQGFRSFVGGMEGQPQEGAPPQLGSTPMNAGAANVEPA